VADNLVGIEGIELSDQWEVKEASLLMHYLDQICVPQMAYFESIEKWETELYNSISYQVQLSDVNVTDEITNSSKKIVAFLKQVNLNTPRRK
jgi:hypothetical protein